jgi:hypothetical protein
MERGDAVQRVRPGGRAVHGQVRNPQWVIVPKGRLKLCTWSAVPSGLVVCRTAVPNVETLGYYRKSLPDKDSRGFCEWPEGIGLGARAPITVELNIKVR